MAWYWWILIIVGGLFAFFSLVSMFNEKARERRRQEFLEDISTWRVGDRLRCWSGLMEEAKNNGKQYPTLVKWSETELLIDLGEKGYTRYIKHTEVHENIDDTWRDRHARMDKFMDSINAKGILKKKKQDKKEGKKSKMDVTYDNGQIHIDGRPLLGMPEIYLSIYQKYCIEEGNHSLLEKIREELKKHR